MDTAYLNLVKTVEHLQLIVTQVSTTLSALVASALARRRWKKQTETV